MIHCFTHDLGIWRVQDRYNVGIANLNRFWKLLCTFPGAVILTCRKFWISLSLHLPKKWNSFALSNLQEMFKVMKLSQGNWKPVSGYLNETVHEESRCKAVVLNCQHFTLIVLSSRRVLFLLFWALIFLKQDPNKMAKVFYSM